VVETVQDRIIKVLSYQDEDISSKQISLFSHTNYNTVRKELSRMVKNGKIIIVKRGYYALPHAQFKNDVIVNAEIALHGLKLEHRCPISKAHPYLQEASSEAKWRPQYVKQSIVEGSHRHRMNRSATDTIEWRGRIITITEHPPSKKTNDILVEVFIRSGDKPLRFVDFELFCEWLSGRFHNILPGNWKVVEFGFNWDVLEYQMKGVSEISLSFLKTAWFKIYNRLDLVRVEVHSIHKISIGEITTLFSSLIKEFSMTTGAGMVKR